MDIRKSSDTYDLDAAIAQNNRHIATAYRAGLVPNVDSADRSDDEIIDMLIKNHGSRLAMIGAMRRLGLFDLPK